MLQQTGVFYRKDKEVEEVVDCSLVVSSSKHDRAEFLFLFFSQLNLLERSLSNASKLENALSSSVWLSFHLIRYTTIASFRFSSGVRNRPITLCIMTTPALYSKDSFGMYIARHASTCSFRVARYVRYMRIIDLAIHTV